MFGRSEHIPPYPIITSSHWGSTLRGYDDVYGKALRSKSSYDKLAHAVTIIEMVAVDKRNDTDDRACEKVRWHRIHPRPLPHLYFRSIQCHRRKILLFASRFLVRLFQKSGSMSSLSPPSPLHASSNICESFSGGSHGHFIAYSTNNTVTLWDVSTHSQLGLVEHSEDVHSVALSSDDGLLAMGGKKWENCH